MVLDLGFSPLVPWVYEQKQWVREREREEIFCILPRSVSRYTGQPIVLSIIWYVSAVNLVAVWRLNDGAWCTCSLSAVVLWWCVTARVISASSVTFLFGILFSCLSWSVSFAASSDCLNYSGEISGENFQIPVTSLFFDYKAQLG